jgi:creatinine amidohydrolase
MGKKRTSLLSEMTWLEVEELRKTVDLAILPVGANDNNGVHSPLGTDTIVASGVAQRLGERTGCLVAPAIPWGNSTVQMGFPGTMHVRCSVLSELVRDLCRSLATHGFRRILIINGHMSNNWPINDIGHELREEGILMALIDWWRVMWHVSMDLAKGDYLPAGHGGEMNTSCVLAFRPDLVDLSRAEPLEPTPGFFSKYLLPHYPRVFVYPEYREQMGEKGAMGDATKSSVEQGEAIVERGLKFLSELVDDMRKAPLPERTDVSRYPRWASG